MITKKLLIEKLQNLDIPDDAPLVVFYNCGNSFNSFDEICVGEITEDMYVSYDSRNYVGPAFYVS